MLSDLPIDIQVLIFPLLTFTDLISLSQTDQWFRLAISPQRHHFVGRLLELECRPEYGDVYDTKCIPDIVEAAAQEARYACSHCLKLLHHSSFDNHSLLRLRYRKPPPGSRAALKLCGWMSGDVKAQGLKRQADLRNDTLEGWKYQHASSSEFSSEELYHVGMLRIRRMCNECKYNTGFWSRETNSNAGTAVTPVIKGRQIKIHDAFERYFPGLFNYDGGFPARRKVYREWDREFEYWTLYSVRCSECSTWQEMAAFRKGATFSFKATPRDSPLWRDSNWQGPKFDEWRCNRCLAKSSSEENLQKALLEYWNIVIVPEIQNIDASIKQGWGWCTVLDTERFGRLNKEKKRFSWTQFMKIAQNRSQLFRRVATVDEVRGMTAEVRRKCVVELRKYLETQSISLGSLEGNSWFLNWLKEYEILEERLEFLRDCTRKLEDHPGILLRYVLDSQTYRIM